MSNLGAGDIDESHLNRTNRYAPNPHIHHRAAGTIPDRIAGIRQFDDCNAANDIRCLLRQEPGQSDRCSGSRLGFTGHIDRYPKTGVHEGPFHLIAIVLERSHRIIGCEREWHFSKLALATGNNRNHPQAVFSHNPLTRRHFHGLARVADRGQVTVDVRRSNGNARSLRHDHA